jgi:hypothetical protein
LLEVARTQFQKVTDPRDPNRIVYSTSDALMASLAMFGLKYPSLLQFDQDARKDDIKSRNLRSVYGLSGVPSDTQMRSIIDNLQPLQIHNTFRSLIGHLQQGKILNGFKYLDGKCLVAGDGTGLFSSPSVHCSSCCSKTREDVITSYYHQAFSLVIVHPNIPQVIPICLESIDKQDGIKKNDCEMNAAKRALEKLRREHPHLGMRLVLDGLFAKAPLLNLVRELDFGFIVVVKEGDHKALFEYFDTAKTSGETLPFHVTEHKDGKTYQHKFSFLNDAPLNASHPDVLVNILEYTQTVDGKTTRWVWVTDLRITKDNAHAIMRAGRARWRIENETFNTLKNLGYEFEHNFGHGYKNLCTNLFYIMMIAFLIDQVQALSCRVFARLLTLAVRRKYLWEQMRSVFRVILCNDFHDFYRKLGLSYDPSFALNSS